MFTAYAFIINSANFMMLGNALSLTHRLSANIIVGFSERIFILGSTGQGRRTVSRQTQTERHSRIMERRAAATHGNGVHSTRLNANGSMYA